MNLSSKMCIKEFRYEYLFLSNFTITPFVYKNILFKTSEHAYQWEKADNKDDKQLILESKTPTQAKQIGHKTKTDIVKWDKNKDVIMKDILLQKFNLQHLKEKLLQTGDIKLVEGNYWHDNYWGDCYCYKCKNVPGKNILGQILMDIRYNITKN